MSFQSLIDRIYEAAAISELWPSVLQEVGMLASASASILFAVHGNQQRLVASPGYEQTIADYYAAGWDRRNDRMARCIGLGHAGFVTETDAYTFSEWTSEPVYKEFLAPRGLGWAAATAIPVPTGEMLVFSFERNAQIGPADLETKCRLDLLRPHLARAALLSWRLAFEKARSAVLALEHVGIPACLIGRDLRLVLANAVFEGFIKDGTVEDRRNRITLGNRNADGLFADALSRLSVPEYEQVSSVPIPATGDQNPLVLHLVPIRGSANDVFSGISAICMVTPVIPAEVATAEVIQGLFDLTPAESRIARFIAEGEMVINIAAKLNRSEQTIRTQLKSVFAKTGVTRQADLALLLTGLNIPIR